MEMFLRERGILVYTADEGKRDKHIRHGWLQMVCPLCGSDRLWLGYNQDKGYFYCYNHGYASKWQLFRAWFPQERPEALLEQIDAPLDYEEKPPVSGRYLPPGPVKPLAKCPFHAGYLRGRGLNPEELAKKWGVGALDVDAPWFYRNRLFFPVYNERGRAVSWLTRTIVSDCACRYLTAPQDRESAPIKSLLYGEHFLSHFETVIVCEGVFDSLRIGRNAVATFGKSITDAQFDKITKYPRRIICFDGEPETQEQAKRLAIRLQAFPGLTDNVCLDAPDPGSAPPHEIEALLKFAELA